MTMHLHVEWNMSMQLGRHSMETFQDAAMMINPRVPSINTAGVPPAGRKPEITRQGPNLLRHVPDEGHVAR
jgi:hypothetical protein